MYHIKIANETFSCHMQDSLLAALKKYDEHTIWLCKWWLWNVQNESCSRSL